MPEPNPEPALDAGGDDQPDGVLQGTEGSTGNDGVDKDNKDVIPPLGLGRKQTESERWLNDL